MSKFNQIIKANKISPENLKLLYDELKMFRNSNYLDKNKKLCTEIISLIIEYLIYGDKHMPQIFDIFCEYNFMNEFIYLSNIESREISIQIIQSFSILILNISSQTTIYFIFSNNFLNQIISRNYEKYDDEFVAYYINFIKSLSLKIDTTTVQFFFHRQYNTFPLLESALKFYNHPDSMIKTTVRNIFLTFIRLKYDPIYEYLSSLPSISYFPFITCNLRDLILKLNDEVISDDNFKLLNENHDEILDLVMYIQDIFSLKIEKINYILINSLLYYLVLPLLIGGIVSIAKVRLNFNSKPRIAISVCIYILVLLFKYIKNESFLNCLFTLIFSEKSDKKLLLYIQEYPSPPKNYFYEWNTKKNYNNSSFPNYVSTNFSEQFVKSLIFQINSPHPEILAIVKKYEKLSEEITNENFFKNILEELLSKFSNSEFSTMQQFHKSISIATGINVGLVTNDFKQKSIYRLLEKFFYKIKVIEQDIVENELSKQTSFDLIKNECRDNLLCYLKSKDDTLILLVSLLIYYMHRSNISKELLSRAMLLKASDFNQSAINTNNILNEIFSVEKSNNLFENFKLNKNESSTSNYLNDIDEKSKDFTFTDDSSINDEKRINTTDLFDNMTIREPIKKELNFVSGNDKINSSPKKFYKDGNAILDNEFFNNFLGENSKLQNCYCKVIIDSLLNLLLLEPSFRTITIRTILVNFENLVGINLENTHLDLLNKIYYSFLSNIKLLILNNKYIKEAGYELFEYEWNNFKKDILSVFNELISRPYLLIPFNLEDIVEDYPNILKLHKNEIDNFKNYLMIFMSIFELRSKILKKNESIKARFPLHLGNKKNLEIDSSFTISTSLYDVYPCKLRIGLQKNINNYIMLIEQNYVLFCLVDSNKQDTALVKYKYALRHLEVQIDRADPRILNLIVKDNKNEYIDLCMYLDEIGKVANIKRMLEEQRKSSRNTEFILLVSYFDELLNNWNLEFNI